jgi:hypothetical protein
MGDSEIFVMYVVLAVNNIQNLMMKVEVLSLSKSASGYMPEGPEIKLVC